MTPSDHARVYLRRGWSPIPIPFRKKAPAIDGWKTLRLTDADLRARFNGQAQNVGVLLGEPSGGLMDVDLDCVETVRLADCFLPKTSAVFGRKSKQRSHRLYIATPAGRITKFEDIDGATLVELRGTGGQTVFPGSVHESGEPIEWFASGEPSRLEYKALHTAVSKLAAMALIARHWPNKGSRHNAANALAGALCNSPLFDRKRIPELVNIVSECAGDDEDRTSTATLTVEKFTNGEHVTGWPTLTEIVGQQVVDRAMKWLGLSRSSVGGTATAPSVNKAKPKSRRIEPYQPFPVHVLPQPIRGFVSASASALGVDESFVALPLLAALASAIGNTRRIRLKRGWAEPSILWCAIIGESGTIKSPAVELALRPVRRIQGEALKWYAEGREEYERAMIAYEAELAAWKKKRIGEQPRKPEKPVLVRYVVSDVTVEALATILQENPRGLLLARDELSGWLRSHNQYRKGQGGDTAHWLEMFHGRPMLVDRKTGENRITYVPRAAVSICGGIQPGTLANALTPEYFECGLAARMLLAMPTRKTKHWTDAEIPASLEDDLAGVFERLLTLQPNPGDSEDDEPHPVDVPLSDGGRAVWVAFYDEHAREESELAGDLAAAWSKLEGIAARLSLVAHFIRWAALYPPLRNPDTIDAESVNTGVVLARWFGHEARRVYGVLGESDEDRDRRRLVELIRRKGGSVTPRDLCRSSRTYPKAEDADAALTGLVEAGLGRWEHIAPGPEGGQPSRRFVLACPVDDTPRSDPVDTVDVDNTTAHDPASGGIVNVNAVNTPETQGSVGAADDGWADDEHPPMDVYVGTAESLESDDPDALERAAIMDVERKAEADPWAGYAVLDENGESFMERAARYRREAGIGA